MNVEQASIQHRSHGEEVIARAPAHVRAAINRARVKSGREPVLSVRDRHQLDLDRRAAEAATLEAETRRGTGVWIEDRGRLVPVGVPAPRSGRSTSRSATTPRSRQTILARVLMTAHYGDAPAAAIRGGTLPETIAAAAFGTAAELNRSPGWMLRDGHDGPVLAVAGERLRAHDTPAGLVVEWTPDLRDKSHRDAVRAIEEGLNAVSVGMVVRSKQTARLPHPTAMVTEATLLHVALLGAGKTPAYSGARAKVFRGCWADDADELRKQIAETIERARWYARQAKVGR